MTDAHDWHAEISVIVLTHNRRDTLRQTLQRLQRLPERPRIAVVDNGSTDGTGAMLAAEFPTVTILRSGANLGAAGRNLGAAWATTPYVAFCDDDCWWHPGSLQRACELFDAYPHVASLTARIEVQPAGFEDPASTLMAHSPLPSDGLPGRAILGLMAGATAFRRAAFRAAGGYDPRFFIGGEETTLALKLADAGWAMVYAPDLLVHHQPSALRDAAARRVLLARNAVWSTWLCLPARMAIADTLRAIPTLVRETDIAGWCDLLRGMTWVLRERRVVSPPVVQALRRVRGQR
ncbi:glycosyltransferase family 2 protein [Cupriavidus pauculus]|uniref:glycosyltransferase family 2 protein n=1 Tax=Cupriavidus pauculus TaxID=82633 RepID=UPI003857A2F1